MYLLHRLALLLVESFHLSGPAPHEIGFHRLVQEDLLALLADHDPEWLLEHFGKMVNRDVFSQVVVPIAAALERREWSAA